MDAAPDKGNNTIGRSEVAAIGISSPIHQMATQIEVAKVACAASESPSKGLMSKTAKKRTGPMASPKYFLVMEDKWLIFQFLKTKLFQEFLSLREILEIVIYSIPIFCMKL